MYVSEFCFSSLLVLEDGEIKYKYLLITSIIEKNLVGTILRGKRK